MTNAVRESKRAALARQLGDIVLAEGLDALSLRPAAARLGTSDRMLLYYFGTKAELVAEVLADLSARLAVRLSAIAASTERTPEAMLREGAALLAAPEVRPFMTVWGEIGARAARGDALFARVVAETMLSWTGWIIARTRFPEGVAPEQGAAALLVVLEGLSRIAGVDGGAVIDALGQCVG